MGGGACARERLMVIEGSACTPVSCHVCKRGLIEVLGPPREGTQSLPGSACSEQRNPDVLGTSWSRGRREMPGWVQGGVQPQLCRCQAEAGPSVRGWRTGLLQVLEGKQALGFRSFLQREEFQLPSLCSVPPCRVCMRVRVHTRAQASGTHKRQSRQFLSN